VETFLANLEDHDKPLVNWTNYSMKRGDKLDQVAARFGLTATKLRSINGLGPRTRIAAGRTLLVPRGGALVVGESVLASLPAPPSEPEVSAAPAKTRTIVVRGKNGKKKLIVVKAASGGKLVKAGQRSTTRVAAKASAGKRTAKATVAKATTGKLAAKPAAGKRGSARSAASKSEPSKKLANKKNGARS